MNWIRIIPLRRRRIQAAGGGSGRPPSAGEALLPLGRDLKGGAAMEFAFAFPILMTMVIGAAQLGIMFFANAGLKSAVGEGARYATTFPQPTHAQIIDRINTSRYGLDPAFTSEPTVATCTSNGRPCLDIEMTYSAPVDFLFVQTPPITFVERRRVFPER